MDDFNEMLASIGIDNTWEGYHNSTETESRESVEEEVVNTASSEEYHENIGEGRDLDAEEDADWDIALASGYISPADHVEIEEDSDGHQFSVHYNAQPEESHSDNGVHFHMPNGEVIDVPVVEESANSNLSEEDISDILLNNGFIEDSIPEQDSIPTNTEEHSEEAEETEVTAPEENNTVQDERLAVEGTPLEDIPLNSPTLLIDNTTSRFSGAEWYKEIQKKSVIVAGIGGIGSNFVYQLARMVPASIYMYDDDDVEIVNMAGQLYSTLDLENSKVDAMANMIQHYTSMKQIFAIKARFTETTPGGDIMICGFDNMSARRTFFNVWQRHVFSLPEDEWKNCLFIDGRLSIDTLQVLCVTGDNSYAMTAYRDQYLFDDSEADATVCSMKQTTYLASMIGSIMVNLFTNFVANSIDPIIPYDLPFFTEYDSQNMIFKTKN